MASVNARLLDAAVGHAIDITRYSTGAVNRLIAILNRADQDLFAQLMIALERVPQNAVTVERIDSLLASVLQINARAYEALRAGLEADLRDLTAYEAEYQLNLFQATIPAPVQVHFAVAAVVPEQVYAAALSRPFQGVLLREALSGVEAAKAQKIREALRMGFIEGKTIDQMVRDLRGTRARGYSDGLLERSRRDVEAIVRTATSHVASFTRDRFIEVNADLVAATSWVSTLDGRTSDQCRIRDSLRYTTDTHKPIGHKVPWGAGPGRLHWQCRSTSAPILKSWRELGINQDDLPESVRASMDGAVPESTSYGDWIKRQSAARQDDILGPTRGRLMRAGGLTQDRFYDDKGKWLTLDQMRARDAKAFERAGIE